jgi:hypothetical protein
MFKVFRRPPSLKQQLIADVEQSIAIAGDFREKLIELREQYTRLDNMRDEMPYGVELILQQSNELMAKLEDRLRARLILIVDVLDQIERLPD